MWIQHICTYLVTHSFTESQRNDVAQVVGLFLKLITGCCYVISASYGLLIFSKVLCSGIFKCFPNSLLVLYNMLILLDYRGRREGQIVTLGVLSPSHTHTHTHALTPSLKILMQCKMIWLYRIDSCDPHDGGTSSEPLLIEAVLLILFHSHRTA